MQKLKHYANFINEELAHLNGERQPASLYEPISYILSLGGKRLRPALTLAGCELFGGKPEQALQPALGIEVFHNFSLMHDDIMDEATLRRGEQTVHQKWDTHTAILSGDAMLVQAYQYLAQVDAALLPKVINAFSTMALQLCEGQRMDLNFEQTSTVFREEYLEMIRLKTSVLLGCALQVGALIGQAGEKQASVLYQFGVSAGIAFQIQDDILDAFGQPEKFGKQVGGDILQDKQTLLMICAREEDGFADLQHLQGESKIAAYQEFFEKSGALKKAQDLREDYLQAALTALETSDGAPELKNELKGFAEWLAHREY